MVVGLLEKKWREEPSPRVGVLAWLAALGCVLVVLVGPVEAGEVVATPELSVPHGFYDQPFRLALETATPEAEIRYTLDGRAPGPRRGKVYREPLTIEQTTVVRAAAFLEGACSERVATATYLFLGDIVRQPGMDRDVVDAPEYRDEIQGALRAIPSLCLSLDPEAVNQKEALLVDEDREHLVSLEFLPTDSRGGVQVDCGVETHSDADPKTSLRVSFRQEYGAGKLHYAFFAEAPLHGGSGTRAFDRLVLRGGRNKSWPNGSFRRQVTYVEDQWVRDTELDVSGIGARGLFCHLYVNGSYWGLYNPVERPDAWFAAAYLGGEPEDYFATNMNSRRGDHVSGDPKRFNELHELAEGLDDPARYARIHEFLDVRRYIDYVILFWFTGLGDGVNNNWYGGMRMDPPGPFRFYTWDSEFVFVPPEANPPGNESGWVPPYFFDGSLDHHTIVKLWAALIRNKEFQVLFADRVYQHCLHDGPLSDNRNRARLLTLTNAIESAMIGESARWGEGRTRDETWRNAVRTLDGKLDGNVETFIRALRAWRHDDWRGVELFPRIDPPSLQNRGGRQGADFLLELRPPADDRGAGGDSYYTLDGSDPRLPGGAISPSAFVYVRPFALPSTPTGRVTVKVRTRLGDTWSPLDEATFRRQESSLSDRLELSEIHYHPSSHDASTRRSEFLELRNTSSETLDLSGARFRHGVDYSFPTGTLLEGGAYFVLTSDRQAFLGLYSEPRNLRVYGGRLSNGGERVTLIDGLDRVVLSVAYDDRFLWPLAADGFGRSLVLADSELDPDEPLAWRTSRRVGGSPGAPDEADLPDTSAGRRLPGDMNQDGSLTIVDGIRLLGRLFAENATALPCGGNSPNEGGDLRLLDFDGNGVVQLTDAVGLFLFLFDSGRPHHLGPNCIAVMGCSSGCA